ncbi:MAG TPA: flagellar assembly protein FliW [Marmoricola sp.]|nr:flagellar assembly protein FliW [Marmoricola sp.]
MSTATLTPAFVETRSAATVVEEIPLIDMVEPMPGFPGVRRFALVRLDEEGVLCALRSVDEPALRFLVVPPQLFFPDYAPVVDDATVATLGIESADDVVVLAVVNAGGSAADATVNLLAPVLVNTATRQGVQVVLTDDLPVRAPLVA